MIYFCHRLCFGILDFVLVLKLILITFQALDISFDLWKNIENNRLFFSNYFVSILAAVSILASAIRHIPCWMGRGDPLFTVVDGKWLKITILNNNYLPSMRSINVYAISLTAYILRVRRVNIAISIAIRCSSFPVHISQCE